MKIRSLLKGLGSITLACAITACVNPAVPATESSTSRPATTEVTETDSATTESLPAETPSTEASTAEATTVEVITTEPTTAEVTDTESAVPESTTAETPATEPTTTEAATAEPSVTDSSETSLANDFVRQLVVRTSEVPVGTAGSSLQMTKLSADWVNQVSVSGLTEQNLQHKVSMAYEELPQDAKASFDDNFQYGIAELSIQLLNGDEAALNALQDAGAQLNPDHMSAESWQGYIDAVGRIDN